MYTELELAHVQETLRTLQNRITERVPGSSLSRVAEELCIPVVLETIPAQK